MKCILLKSTFISGDLPLVMSSLRSICFVGDGRPEQRISRNFPYQNFLTSKDSNIGSVFLQTMWYWTIILTFLIMPWVLKATPCCFLYSSENVSALLLICVIQKPSDDATSSRIESIRREARSIHKRLICNTTSCIIKMLIYSDGTCKGLW